jgi:hypothetical protein
MTTVTACNFIKSIFFRLENSPERAPLAQDWLGAALAWMGRPQEMTVEEPQPLTTPSVPGTQLGDTAHESGGEGVCSSPTRLPPTSIAHLSPATSPGEESKYTAHHATRLQTSANHILYYVVDRQNQAHLAVVVRLREGCLSVEEGGLIILS